MEKLVEALELSDKRMYQDKAEQKKLMKGEISAERPDRLAATAPGQTRGETS